MSYSSIYIVEKIKYMHHYLISFNKQENVPLVGRLYAVFCNIGLFIIHLCFLLKTCFEYLSNYFSGRVKPSL